MIKDSSTECWNQVNIDEWIDKAQTNDFRVYYIMPYTLELLGDVKGKYILAPKEWIGESKGINAPILYRHRTLSDYIKAFVKNSFKLMDMNEPIPTEEQSQMSSRVAYIPQVKMKQIESHILIS